MSRMMAPTNFNPLALARDVSYFDRDAPRQTTAGGGGRGTQDNSNPNALVGSVTPMAPGASGGSYNSSRSTNQESADAGDANTYANTAFKKWYGGLAPAEQSKFAGNPGGVQGVKATLADGTVYDKTGPRDADNLAAIQQENARQHFTQNILPGDAGYVALQGKAQADRSARIAGVSPTDYQTQTANATGATNTAAAIGADAANRTTTANANAGEAQARGALDTANANVLVPAQARGLDATTGATTQQTQIAGQQWAAQKPLYPQSLGADIAAKNAQANEGNARGDAARTEASAKAVTAYGTANRPTTTKDDNGQTVTVPPAFSYGAPAAGQSFPTITPRAPMSMAPATSGPPAPAPAPAQAAPAVPPQAPSFWDNPEAKVKGAMGGAVSQVFTSPSSLLVPMLGAPYNAAKGAIAGWRGAGAAPAAPASTPAAAPAAQFADGQVATIRGQKYIRQRGQWQALAAGPTR